MVSARFITPLLALLQLVVVQHLLDLSDAFSSPQRYPARVVVPQYGGLLHRWRRTRRFHLLVLLHQQPPQPTMYGRGDEIWPPTNENTPIRFQDSLVDASFLLTSNGGDIDNDSSQPDRRLLSYRRPLVLISTLVVTIYNLIMTTTTSFSYSTSTTNDNPLSFLPLDLLILIGISGYFLLIHRLDVLPTPSMEDRRTLSLYDHPLGAIDTVRYELWDTVGTYIGIILPFLYSFMVIGNTGSSSNSSSSSGDNYVTTMMTMMILGRPIVFYCAQRLSEHVATNMSTALPLRAMIPILYTAVRLLYYCCFYAKAQEASSWIILALTVVNVAYAVVQLFLVLPWVALRYLRVHCFLVEANSVELRSEASIGMTPR